MQAPTAADFEVAIKLLDKVAAALSASSNTSSSRTTAAQLHGIEQQAEKLVNRLGRTHGAAMARAAFSKLLKNKVSRWQTCTCEFVFSVDLAAA